MSSVQWTVVYKSLTIEPRLVDTTPLWLWTPHLCGRLYTSVSSSGINHAHKRQSGFEDKLPGLHTILLGCPFWISIHDDKTDCSSNARHTVGLSDHKNRVCEWVMVILVICTYTLWGLAKRNNLWTNMTTHKEPCFFSQNACSPHTMHKWHQFWISKITHSVQDFQIISFQAP